MSAVRVDGDGEPRLYGPPVSMDELVRLGFEQVRHAARDQPVITARLATLADEVSRAAREAGVGSGEATRQAALLRGEEE